jgi:hypothetical protein
MNFILSFHTCTFARLAPGPFWKSRQLPTLPSRRSSAVHLASKSISLEGRKEGREGGREGGRG